MLKSIISSFARSYGRSLGYSAARRTSWLAIPLLLVVVVLGLLQLAGSYDWQQLTVWLSHTVLTLPPAAIMR